MSLANINAIPLRHQASLCIKTIEASGLHTRRHPGNEIERIVTRKYSCLISIDGLVRREINKSNFNIFFAEIFIQLGSASKFLLYHIGREFMPEFNNMFLRCSNWMIDIQ